MAILPSYGWRPFAGTIFLVVGIIGAFSISAILSAGSPPFPLNILSLTVDCTHGKRGLPDALHLYAMQANWLTMMGLLVVVSVFTGVVSLVAMTTVTRDCRRAGRLAWYGGFWSILVLSLLCVTIRLLWPHDLWPHDQRHFISYLLQTLPNTAGCNAVRDGVVAARVVGEIAGFVVGTAMATLVVFAGWPTPDQLRARIEWLQRLLFCASLIFVVSIPVSRADLTWILTTWVGDGSSKAWTKAVGELISTGVVRSAVGYTALMAVFFIPLRSCLAWLASSIVPEEHARSYGAKLKWLEEHHLRASWRDETKQILALLAPVVSVPVLDAFLK